MLQRNRIVLAPSDYVMSGGKITDIAGKNYDVAQKIPPGRRPPGGKNRRGPVSDPVGDGLVGELAVRDGVVHPVLFFIDLVEFVLVEVFP